MSNQSRHSHRGLSSHYIAPMLGAHPALNLAPFGRWTLRDKAAQPRLALRLAFPMPITNRIVRKLILCLVACFAQSCLADFSRSSIIIVNPDGERINTYCVAPLYVKEKSNGDFTNRLYLKWPVSIESKDDLSQKTRGTDFWVFYLGFGLTPPIGTAISWSSLLFIKRGYVPVVSKNTYDTIYPKTLVMNKGDSDKVLSLLLSREKNPEEIRALFQIDDVKRTWEVMDEYSESDRELLRKCYTDQAR